MRQGLESLQHDRKLVTRYDCFIESEHDSDETRWKCFLPALCSTLISFILSSFHTISYTVFITLNKIISDITV